MESDYLVFAGGMEATVNLADPRAIGGLTPRYITLRIYRVCLGTLTYRSVQCLRERRSNFAYRINRRVSLCA